MPGEEISGVYGAVHWKGPPHNRLPRIRLPLPEFDWLVSSPPPGDGPMIRKILQRRARTGSQVRLLTPRETTSADSVEGLEVSPYDGGTANSPPPGPLGPPGAIEPEVVDNDSAWQDLSEESYPSSAYTITTSLDEDRASNHDQLAQLLPYGDLPDEALANSTDKERARQIQSSKRPGWRSILKCCYNMDSKGSEPSLRAVQVKTIEDSESSVFWSAQTSIRSSSVSRPSTRPIFSNISYTTAGPTSPHTRTDTMTRSMTYLQPTSPKHRDFAYAFPLPPTARPSDVADSSQPPISASTSSATSAHHESRMDSLHSTGSVKRAKQGPGVVTDSASNSTTLSLSQSRDGNTTRELNDRRTTLRPRRDILFPPKASSVATFSTEDPPSPPPPTPLFSLPSNVPRRRPRLYLDTTVTPLYQDPPTLSTSSSGVHTENSSYLSADAINYLDDLDHNLRTHGYVDFSAGYGSGSGFTEHALQLSESQAQAVVVTIHPGASADSVAGSVRGETPPVETSSLSPSATPTSNILSTATPEPAIPPPPLPLRHSTSRPPFRLPPAAPRSETHPVPAKNSLVSSPDTERGSQKEIDDHVLLRWPSFHPSHFERQSFALDDDNSSSAEAGPELTEQSGEPHGAHNGAFPQGASSAPVPRRLRRRSLTPYLSPSPSQDSLATTTPPSRNTCSSLAVSPRTLAQELSAARASEREREDDDEEERRRVRDEVWARAVRGRGRREREQRRERRWEMGW